MSKLVFHKCRICGKIFYCTGKDTYCSSCVPRFKGLASGSARAKAYFRAFRNTEAAEIKRARDRARWHARMANPQFREHERLRSLARARAEKKYATKESEDATEN